MSKEDEIIKAEKDLHIVRVIRNFSSMDKIKAISEVVYPKEIKRDIDGDWYDINESKREGFTSGCLVILKQCGIDLKTLT